MLPIESGKKYVTLNFEQDTVLSVVFGSAGVVDYDQDDVNLRIVDQSVDVDVGYSYDGENFWAPAQIEKTIDINGPVEVNIDTATPYNVEVRVDGVVDNSYNQTHYLPLMNKITGELAQMLKVEVTAGTAVVSVTLSAAGMYAIDFSKLTPALSDEYKLTGVKELVVL